MDSNLFLKPALPKKFAEKKKVFIAKKKAVESRKGTWGKAEFLRRYSFLTPRYLFLEKEFHPYNPVKRPLVLEYTQKAMRRYGCYLKKCDSRPSYAEMEEKLLEILDEIKTEAKNVLADRCKPLSPATLDTILNDLDWSLEYEIRNVTLIFFGGA